LADKRPAASASTRAFSPLASAAHVVDDHVVIKWLLDKIDRSSLHRPHSHGQVAVAGDDHHWQGGVVLGQLFLNFQAAEPGHAHVEYNATHPIGLQFLKKFHARTEGAHRQADSVEKRAHGVTHRVVIVEHKDRSLRAHADATGKVKRKVMPQSSLRSATRRPP